MELSGLGAPLKQVFSGRLFYIFTNRTLTTGGIFPGEVSEFDNL